jgi:hypothetical protein
MIRCSLLLGALSLALAGCGAEDSRDGSRSYPPVPGCEHIDHAPCDTMETSCQTLRLELAACLRGSEPGELPPVTRWTEQQYTDYLRAALAENPRPAPDHSERALSILGLVKPGGFAPDPMVMDRVAWIWGFYSSETRDITLIDHGQPAADARWNALLTHELVHALQDRDVDLQAYHREHGVSYDAMLAERAITEGEARLHETRYTASLHGVDPAKVDWREQFEDQIASGERWVSEQPSPLLASLSVFPYDYGQRFVDFAWRSGGHDAVLALMSAPPSSTQVLMASSDGPSEPPVPVELSPPTPPEGWSPPGNDVLGALGLFLTLTRVASAEAVRPAALAWRSDLFSVYAGPSQPSETALVWQLELADETSAGTVAANLETLVGSTYVKRQGTRVVITSVNSVAWAFVP